MADVPRVPRQMAAIVMAAAAEVSRMDPATVIPPGGPPPPVAVPGVPTPMAAPVTAAAAQVSRMDPATVIPPGGPPPPAAVPVNVLRAAATPAEAAGPKTAIIFADTLAEHIGESCMVDVRNMSAFFVRLGFRVLIIAGVHFTRQNIIENVLPGANRVHYFSCHSAKNGAILSSRDPAPAPGEVPLSLANLTINGANSVFISDTCYNQDGEMHGDDHLAANDWDMAAASPSTLWLRASAPNGEAFGEHGGDFTNAFISFYMNHADNSVVGYIATLSDDLGYPNPFGNIDRMANHNWLGLPLYPA